MEQNSGFFEFINQILNYNILPIGDAKITLLSLFYLVVFLIVLFWASSRLRDFLTNRVLAKTNLDSGAQLAIGTITRYFILFLGFLVIMQTVGIDLTTLNVLAGAVGVGIGFGLQNIASNFISGLIILLERPIKVGDRIEVGAIAGKVTSVGARSTIVKTKNNISIIIPNTKLISENVVNWTYDSHSLRVGFDVNVRVTADSDVNLVRELMLETAAQNADVLQDPAPTVMLRNFEGGAINMDLSVWSRTKLQSKLHLKGKLVSDLNYAVHDKFKQHGIEFYVSDSSSGKTSTTGVPPTTPPSSESEAENSEKVN